MLGNGEKAVGVRAMSIDSKDRAWAVLRVGVLFLVLIFIILLFAVPEIPIGIIRALAGSAFPPVVQAPEAAATTAPVTPEPATLALLAAGAGAVALLARKRRKRPA